MHLSSLLDMRREPIRVSLVLFPNLFFQHSTEDFSVKEWIHEWNGMIKKCNFWEPKTRVDIGICITYTLLYNKKLIQHCKITTLQFKKIKTNLKRKGIRHGVDNLNKHRQRWLCPLAGLFPNSFLLYSVCFLSKELHILNVYNLMSLDIHKQPGYHHHR